MSLRHNHHSIPPDRKPKADINGSNGFNGPVVGIAEWFGPGEYTRVEKVMADMHELGVSDVRIGVSWADWHTPEGKDWYDRVLPKLAAEVSVLPCFTYTPPSFGVAARTSSPPRNPKLFTHFVDEMIGRYGDHFEWVELWNEPGSPRYWDSTLDPDWMIFSEMIGGAAYWARKKGKKIVLPLIRSLDPNWLKLMFERGVMEHVDAVGLHAFPGTYDHFWDGWETAISRIRRVLEQHGSHHKIWTTETGFSTWQYDERRQVAEFLQALEAPVERVYWHGLYDLDPEIPAVDGFHTDERDYHLGLKCDNGVPKLLYRLWANGGLEAVKESAWITEPVHLPLQEEKPALITGGSGFIGTNLANRILESGRPVILYDNLSRPGVEKNLKWLKETHGDMVQIETADIRDPYSLRKVVRNAGQVFHLAAQVAVTTSLDSPFYDLEVNIRGTLNLLEALRSLDNPPPLVFTSTNKVYGSLEDVSMHKNTTRYEPEDPGIHSTGISEARMLDFHSPYGCSKGAADQYVVDYARVFDLRTVVFRMSCIYGPHQFGTEDQGWVAHFLIRAIEDKPITIYGDGMQVRDILFVEDLVDAFLLAQERMNDISGQAFNIGGGPLNTISLLELIKLIEDMSRQRPDISFADWRPGDQRYYVTDTGKFRKATGWKAKHSVRDGIQKLYGWLVESRKPVAAKVAARKGA